MQVTEEFVHCLQALAVDAEGQLARYPDFVVKADELVLDFDNQFKLHKAQIDESTAAEARASIYALDAYIDSVSGDRFPHVWTDAGIRSSKEWAEIRRLACVVCDSFGFEVNCPPPTKNMYASRDHFYDGSGPPT